MQRRLSRIERQLAPVMFGAVLVYLTFLSGVLHIPDEDATRSLLTCCEWGLLLTWPVFLIEAIVHRVAGSKCWKHDLLFCLFPPFRLAAREHASGRFMWLPIIGWTAVDRDLRLRVEKALSIPMIAIALMVLPLTALDYFSADKIAPGSSMALFIQIGTGLIWLAFAAEFLVMISVVDRKLQYCKEHWIDVAVICLPLIAFLRAARLTRLLRLQQLSKTARMYRLRGVLMRTYRAVLVLDVVERLFRGSPETRLGHLREQLVEKEQEVLQIRGEIEELEAALARLEPASPQRKAA